MTSRILAWRASIGIAGNETRGDPHRKFCQVKSKPPYMAWRGGSKFLQSQCQVGFLLCICFKQLEWKSTDIPYFAVLLNNSYN